MKTNIAITRTIQTGVTNKTLHANGISTRKYTWFSFLPVSLLFQFRSISNAYFLLTAIIMMIPDVSPVSPYSAVIPLCFVLAVSEIREFVEEYQKSRRDTQTNETIVKRVNKKNQRVVLEEVTWASLHPGDLIVLFDRDKVPADVVVMYSSSDNFSYVETSNLDGETNLKTRQAPQRFDHVVEEPVGDDPPIEAYDFGPLFGHQMTFEPPNPDMYRFKGSITGDSTLSITNMMLRGCSMRNTAWAVGVVIYSGHESKAMLNSQSAGVTPSKKTTVERRMNIMVLIVFACQMLLVMGSTFGYSNASDSGAFTVWYLDNSTVQSPGFVALTFFVLLNTIIPMSLWVSLEILKFLQATLMEADAAMKDASRGLGCVAHSKNMNEELGQVTHVFSDKTGTLTCNRMEFKGCAISGKMFTDLDIDDDDPMGATVVQGSPECEGAGIADRSSGGFSGAIPISAKLLSVITENIDEADDGFFKCIALCHSCERVARHEHAPVAAKAKRNWWGKVVAQPATATAAYVRPTTAPGVSAVYKPDPAKFIYQSTSPDEAALVCSAADVGFFFHKRLSSSIQVDIRGEANVFEVVHQIAFSSDRRMMSVLVRENGAISVYTKGADSSVLPLCVEGPLEHTTWAVELFAEQGLRTLCLAVRRIEETDWSVLEARINACNVDIDTRDAAVAVIDAEIEQGMTLLGCTAVEDKLQEGVHQTIAAMRTAGITVCMITGDKRETAINIARSCKLVNSDNNVYTMSTQDHMYGGGNFIHLDSLAELVGDGRADPLWGMAEGRDVETRPGRKSSVGSLPAEERPSAGLGSAVVKDRVVTLSPLASHVHRGADNNKFCIVLDGAALSVLLANPSQTRKLLTVMAHPQCEAAVFCRVNPKQKGLIVKSCRDRLVGGCVLAIGDGANDISMIKEAHVGIGIFGEEGWQAAGSADYAITKFRDLYRLLFIHGRWNYVRITFFISFFMYKNFAFTFLQFWMATLSQWTGISVLEDVAILCFNSVFMVGPLFTAGLFDKDINPDADRPSRHTLKHPAGMTDENWYVNVVPRLYSPGQNNELFRSKRIFGWLALGLVHSVSIFFAIFASWAFADNAAIESDGYVASFTMQQQALYTALLMALVSLHASMIKEWNVIYAIGSIGFHFLLYIGFVIVYDSLSNKPYNYLATATFGNWNFWFTFFITIAFCVFPLVLFNRFADTYRVKLVDVISSKRLSKQEQRNRRNQLREICVPKLAD